MTTIYSQFGCSGNYLIDRKDINLKLIIDPPKNYFYQKLAEDRIKFDKLILLQGMEPKEINFIDKEIIQFKNNFDIILTSSMEVLNSCENSEKFLGVSSWILTDNNKNQINLKQDYTNIFSTNKNFKLSNVMSKKNFLHGHQLRHKVKEIVKKQRNFELFFPESIPTNQKYKLFEDTMFHIAIENTRNHNYISEKILDCFMSYTLPIYWGCPNIGDYFNTEGIILFENEEQLENILDNLDENQYKKRIDAIIENYNIAHSKYAFWHDRINEYIQKV